MGVVGKIPGILLLLAASPIICPSVWALPFVLRERQWRRVGHARHLRSAIVAHSASIAVFVISVIYVIWAERSQAGSVGSLVLPMFLGLFATCWVLHTWAGIELRRAYAKA